MIESLKNKILEIDDLLKSEDRPHFEQWHKEVEMILEMILDSNSHHLNDFSRLNGKPHVYTPRDPAANMRRSSEAYFLDLGKAKSLLNAISYGISLKSTVKPEEKIVQNLGEASHSPLPQTNITIINQNRIEIEITLSISQISNEIESDTSLSVEQKSEAQCQLKIIEEELAKSKPKWEPIKSVLIWALNFSEKIFIELLPIILMHYGKI